MADPRFFKREKIKTLGELAELSGSTLSEKSDAEKQVTDVAPLDTAGASDVSFFDNAKYREHLHVTKAGACVLAPDQADDAPAGVALLLNKSPYKAYALIAQAFYPMPMDEYISSRADVNPTAEIGLNCTIESGAVIGPGVKIGNNCRIGANAVISHAIIGDHVRIYPGCCIGQDGFGFAIDPAGHVKVPQLGRVVIEDHVEIGSNSCIDRGAGPDTIIGQGTWIDNLVQIAHNVKIGRGCVIVAHVGIAGSASIGDYVLLGGQSGIAGHLHIGKGARIGAQSGIMRDVPPGQEMLGSPAFPIKQRMRQLAFLSSMVKKSKD